jgi:hypothetical protein
MRANGRYFRLKVASTPTHTSANQLQVSKSMRTVRTPHARWLSSHVAFRAIQIATVRRSFSCVGLAHLDMRVVKLMASLTARQHTMPLEFRYLAGIQQANVERLQAHVGCLRRGVPTANSASLKPRG